MSRFTNVNEYKLDELVPLYAHNKQEADAYKKIAENYAASIKSVMAEQDVKTYTAGNITVTKVVSVRETLNEDLLLRVAEKHGLPVIKTVKVVDTDLLERYLYNHELSNELAEDLAKCKSSTEVVSLRIKEAKK